MSALVLDIKIVGKLQCVLALRCDRCVTVSLVDECAEDAGGEVHNGQANDVIGEYGGDLGIWVLWRSASTLDIPLNRNCNVHLLEVDLLFRDTYVPYPSYLACWASVAYGGCMRGLTK